MSSKRSIHSGRSLVGCAASVGVREACSALSHVTVCTLPEFPKDPSTAQGSAASLPPRTLQLLSAGTKVTGRDSRPLKDSALARRTRQYT
jgi:hypothetical protein